jgi:O-succinylbenzoate synthase
MAQAAVDFAVWDLFAMSSGVSLSEYIGGTRESIPVGISLGQRATAQEFVDAVEEALGRGFKRIKCKISPGFPIELLEDVRRRHPELPLSVDANGTFSAANFDELCRYDSLSLTMIEQPFHPKDFLLSAELQKSIHTDICLDESIEDLFDLELAHHLKAGKSINIKPARVGGLTQSIAIRDRALEMGLSVWVGGLMETGIGRAVNLAFASTVDEAFPHDIAECGRYCSDELVKEVFCLMPHARLKVPVERSGLGVTVNQEALSRYTVEHARVF